MIEWTDEDVTAAIDALHGDPTGYLRHGMRAALDAAMASALKREAAERQASSDEQNRLMPFDPPTRLEGSALECPKPAPGLEFGADGVLRSAAQAREAASVPQDEVDFLYGALCSLGEAPNWEPLRKTLAALDAHRTKHAKPFAYVIYEGNAAKGILSYTLPSNEDASEYELRVDRLYTHSAPAPQIPEEVMQALDRMCTLLDPSRLSGATAEADARCMAIIRAHILGAAAPKPGDEHGE